jgi:phosphohistidine swiveling domain-containing protein
MRREASRMLRARIPDHVVHRDFPEETVVLNIETGTYHGLNYTARRMFAVLAEADTIVSAAAILGAEFGVPRMRIERDLLELCAALCDRGLLELDDDEAA